MYKYVKKKRNTKSDSYTCPLQVTAMYVKNTAPIFTHYVI